jgi:hypothetical protein
MLVNNFTLATSWRNISQIWNKRPMGAGEILSGKNKQVIREIAK